MWLGAAGLGAARCLRRWPRSGVALKPPNRAPPFVGTSAAITMGLWLRTSQDGPSLPASALLLLCPLWHSF